MSSHGKARCIALALAAVLLLSAVVPAQAAVLGSRGTSSSVIDALWSWLGAAWEAFVPVSSTEKEGSGIDPNGGIPPKGSGIDPNGGAPPQGALIDPNGGGTVQSESDQGSGIDPNGGPRP